MEAGEKPTEGGRATIRVSPSSPKRDPAIKPSINPPINPPLLFQIHNHLSAKPADSSENGWTYVSRFSRAQQGAGGNGKMQRQGSRPQIREPEPERKRSRPIKTDDIKRMAPSKSTPGWKFASSSMATPWSQICKMGRSMEDECRLDYVEPFKDPSGNFIAKVPRFEILHNIERWKNTLVGYVIGDEPFYMHLKGCVGRLWEPSCSLIVHSRDNSYFFFKFGDSEECDRVLRGGPWLFDGRLIVLRRWSERVGLERDLLSTVPVWIRFPSLDPKLWSRSIINRIASLVGTPLYMDRATTSGDKISYARVLVKIKADKELISKVKLQVEEEEGVEMIIDIEYEWKPPMCRQCKSFGHIESQCPTIVVWMPKDMTPEAVKQKDHLPVEGSSVIGAQFHSPPDLENGIGRYESQKKGSVIQVLAEEADADLSPNATGILVHGNNISMSVFEAKYVTAQKDRLHKQGAVVLLEQVPNRGVTHYQSNDPMLADVTNLDSVLIDLSKLESPRLLCGQSSSMDAFAIKEGRYEISANIAMQGSSSGNSNSAANDVSDTTMA